jgi:hypothetical protein
VIFEAPAHGVILAAIGRIKQTPAQPERRHGDIYPVLKGSLRTPPAAD